MWFILDYLAEFISTLNCILRGIGHETKFAWSTMKLWAFVNTVMDLTVHERMSWPVQFLQNCRDGRVLKDLLGVTSKVRTWTANKQRTVSSNLSLPPCETCLHHRNKTANSVLWRAIKILINPFYCQLSNEAA